MNSQYPDDADGDALRRVESLGYDMSRSMDIEFHIAAPDELTAYWIVSKVNALGFDTSVSFDDAELDLDSNDDFLWTCTCTRNMVPEYTELVEWQARLNQIAQPLGGFVDGWGTFGNTKPA